MAQSKKVMASGTLSAQVRIQLTSPLLTPPPSPPHFCSHYTTWGKLMRARQRKGAAGVREAGSGLKIIQRRKNYPASGGGIFITGGWGWAKNSKKKSKKISQCRKLSHSAENALFHIFIHWTQLYLIFLHSAELRPILKHWAEIYPILIHWAELYPILIHWAKLYPILIHWRTYAPSLPNLYPILTQWRT